MMPGIEESHSLQQEQLREHDELMQLLDELGELFGRISAPNQNLVSRLENLALALASHFSFEETQGLFRRIKAAFPRLEKQAQTLEGEHGRLRGALTHILDEARHGAAARWPLVVAEFSAFRGQLQAHEQGEHQLLQQAYDQDLGAQD